jgi:predicted Zn finger-like uncharacterized protein
MMTMVDEKYTRCPGCNTIFRVTPDQLAIRAGQVRCGHCRTVFDGLAAVVSLAPHHVAQAETSDDYDAITHGPPTVTLRDAQALHAVAADAELPAVAATSAPTDEPGDAATVIDPEVAYAARFSGQESDRRRAVPTWIYGAAIPLLVLLFAAQAVFHFRDAIASHWPAARSALAGICTTVGCEVRPLQEIAALSIEASDLQADPAHKGLLVFTATIRNRAPYALAYPMVELTLSDTQDHAVVRRAFAPKEYVSGTADTSGGISGNGELAVKLFIDASATTQAGYQVYLFYP